MLIILEGPDGAGKTTFRENLIKNYEELGVKQEIYQFHNGPYPTPKEAEEAFSAQIMEAETADPNKTIFIFDRTYISERIYSEIFREDKIPDGDYWDLDVRVSKLYHRILLFLPPLRVAMDNWKEGMDEMFDDEEKYLRVYHSYSYLERYTKNSFQIVDYTNGGR